MPFGAASEKPSSTIKSMHPGMATPAGTAHFASRFPDAEAQGFYRSACGWRVSSLGLGSYLGDLTEETDVGYYGSILDAVTGGINVLDTAINYRHQRSEMVIGSALRKLFREEIVTRGQVVVCSKAGYLTPGAVPEGMVPPDEVVRGIHCMHPAFLADQIHRSRENLGLETIDIHYLHNPETQLSDLGETAFLDRMRRAFEALEQCRERRWIQFYGTATWDGYRRREDAQPGLQLERLVDLARQVAGDHHGFRVIQVPFNLAMTEAFTLANQGSASEKRSVLQVAAVLGITVVASASILQSRLSHQLPVNLSVGLPEESTNAQRALQFARSAPGITTALVGMSNRTHVAENLGLTKFAPLPEPAFRQLF